MIFSKRNELAAKVYSWMSTNGLPYFSNHVFNTITALDALGYLNEEGNKEKIQEFWKTCPFLHTVQDKVDLCDNPKRPFWNIHFEDLVPAKEPDHLQLRFCEPNDCQFLSRPKDQDVRTKEKKEIDELKSQVEYWKGVVEQQEVDIKYFKNEYTTQEMDLSIAKSMTEKWENMYRKLAIGFKETNNECTRLKIQLARFK